MKKSTSIYGFCFLLLVNTAANATTMIYRGENFVSKDQSPFIQGIQNGSLTFNSFETAAVIPNLNYPGFLLYSSFSIDGDDGAIDDIQRGRSLKTVARGGPKFILTFTPDADGHYPRYFGVAFPTAVSADFYVPAGFIAQNDAERHGAFEVIGVQDAFGDSVLSNYIFDTPWDEVGSSHAATSSYWGVFFGIYNEAGISQVTLYNTLWLDHLQYGYQIPEPSSAWACALVLAARRRRKI